jgi:hypothetical protein
VLLNNDYLAKSGEKTMKKCQNNIFTHGTPYLSYFGKWERGEERKGFMAVKQADTK